METFTYEVWHSNNDVRKSYAETKTVVVVHKENKATIKQGFTVENFSKLKEKPEIRKQRQIRKYLNENNDLRSFSKDELRRLDKTVVFQQIGKRHKRRIVKKLVEKNTLNLLVWNGNSIRHARTYETIIGTSLLAKKRIPRNKCQHLRRFARQPYHTAVNQQLINGKFVIKEVEVEDGVFAKTIVWQPNSNLPYEQPKYRKTKQYKTTWFSKHQRRQ